MKYLWVIVSAIGGICLMYGTTHERMWYVFGISLIFVALRNIGQERK